MGCTRPSSGSSPEVGSGRNRPAAAEASGPQRAQQALQGGGVLDEALGGVEQAAGGPDHLLGRGLQVLAPRRTGRRARQRAWSRAPFEDHLQGATLEAGVGDGLAPQRVGQGDGPTVRADPDQQLVAPAAQLEVVAVGEGQVERQGGPAAAAVDPQGWPSWSMAAGSRSP